MVLSLHGSAIPLTIHARRRVRVYVNVLSVAQVAADNGASAFCDHYVVTARAAKIARSTSRSERETITGESDRAAIRMLRSASGTFGSGPTNFVARCSSDTSRYVVFGTRIITEPTAVYSWF